MFIRGARLIGGRGISNNVGADVSNSVTSPTSDGQQTTVAPPNGRSLWKIITPIAVLVAIAAIAVVVYAQHGHSKSRASSAPPARTAAAGAAAKPATFSLPATVDGLPKSTDEQATALANATVSDLSASLGNLTSAAVLGTYSAGKPPDAAVLVGLPSTPNDAGAEISNIFDALRSTQFFSIPDPVPADASAPGAVMQCANASIIGGYPVAVGICVQSSSTGSTVLLRLTKTGTQTAAILKAIVSKFQVSQ
jgi:hypothetical protein